MTARPTGMLPICHCRHKVAKNNRPTFNTMRTGWTKKRGHKLMAIILSNLNRFTNFFHEKIRFLGKFAAKWLLKILPLFANVATLACETLMSENKRLRINYKVVKLHI